MRRREFIAGLGGAVAWPLAARAQQTGVPPNQRRPLPTDPVIGFLDMFGPGPPPVGGNKADGGESGQSGRSLNPFVEAFRKGIEDGDFGGEANLFVLYRSAGGNFRLLPSLVADLVGRQVAVVVAVGALAPASRAKAATATIPIVLLYGGDPVQDQLVASLNRPGGNVTGITAFVGEPGGLDGKRLELLLQLVPQARKVAFLSGDRSFTFYEKNTTSMLAAGRARR